MCYLVTFLGLPLLGMKLGAEGHSSVFRQSWLPSMSPRVPSPDWHPWVLFLPCLDESLWLLPA